jgi:hypothetical protein
MCQITYTGKLIRPFSYSNQAALSAFDARKIVKTFVTSCQAKGVEMDSYALPVAHSFERPSLSTTAISNKVLVLTRAGSRSQVDAGWAIELERAEEGEREMLGCAVMLDREDNSIRSVEVFEDGAEGCGGEVARHMVGTGRDGDVESVVIRPVLGFLAR